jgi:hypothetical protein
MKEAQRAKRRGDVGLEERRVVKFGLTGFQIRATAWNVQFSAEAKL